MAGGKRVAVNGEVYRYNAEITAGVTPTYDDLLSDLRRIKRQGIPGSSSSTTQVWHC